MDGVYNYNYRRIKKLCRSQHHDNVFIGLLLMKRIVGIGDVCTLGDCRKEGYIPGKRIYLCNLYNCPWNPVSEKYYCNIEQNDPIIWTIHEVEDGQVRLHLGVGFHLMELCKSMMLVSSKHETISIGRVSYKDVFRCVTENLAWRLRHKGIRYDKKQLLFNTGYYANRKENEQTFTGNIVYYMQRLSKKRVKKTEAFKIFEYGKSIEEWCSSEYEEPVSLCV